MAFPVPHYESDCFIIDNMGPGIDSGVDVAFGIRGRKYPQSAF
jgi:hypothetical protein